MIPLAVILIVFYLYPIVSMSRLSFYATRFGFGDMRFAGLKNFAALPRNPAFLPAVKNSIVWTLVSWVIQLTLPLGLAILMNQRLRGITVARSIMLIPWLTPAVVVALTWRWILEPVMGVLNRQLIALGIFDSRVNFLGSESLALITLIIINSLKYMPFGTLLILAALQTIPESLFEAMKVDGATSLQQLRYLIMPMIGPMIGFMGFLVLVWNFNVFDLIQLTTAGGPVNSTMTIPVLIFRTAYRVFNMGQAASLAVLVIIVVVIAGSLYFKFSGSGAEGE